MTWQHSPTYPGIWDWWDCLLGFLIWSHQGRWSLAKIEDLKDRRCKFDPTSLKCSNHYIQWVHLLFLQLEIFLKQCSPWTLFPWSSPSKLDRIWSRQHWPSHLWRTEELDLCNNLSLLLHYRSLWGTQMALSCLESVNNSSDWILKGFCKWQM